MTFLALDIGTSFIKGAVLNVDTQEIKHVQRIPFPEPLPNLPPLFCEIAPYQIIAATRDLMARLAPHAPDCEGIVMCGQMQGLVLTDDRAASLSNYISWRDQRAQMPHPSGGAYFEVMVQHTGAIVGWLTLDGKRVPCYAPVGDQPCALVGALLREHEFSINISTGSQVALLSPRLQFGDYQKRPFFDGKYLNLVTHIPAGRALAALVELLTAIPRAHGIELEAWEYIAREAAQVHTTDLRVNLAFFASAAGDRGAIENIREDNLTVGNLFRAAFENMAENYLACAQRLSPERAWERIVFSGGLAHKIDLLRRIVAQKLDAPYRVCPASEDALFGLLLLARVFSGREATVAQAIEGSKIPEDREFLQAVAEDKPIACTIAEARKSLEVVVTAQSRTG